MDIGVLRQAILGTTVEYTAHCQKRMLERDISREDIKNCILSGEIIEEYPLSPDNRSEKSYPSFLILSACYPDMQHWLDDYKTRR